MIIDTFPVGVLQCNCTILGDVSSREASGERRILFAGDTLFMNGIGRTDLWGGSETEILSSIANRLMTLDDDTIVIAGHGRSTTIGDERRSNRFLRK